MKKKRQKKTKKEKKKKNIQWSQLTYALVRKEHKTSLG